MLAVATTAALNDFFNSVNAVIWGWPMLILLLGTHLFMTIRLRFPQRHLLKGIRLSVSRDDKVDGDVHPFAALATSLAGQIGTGNIVGVATAVLAGGPGAVLWCWLTGIFGMATKYCEALLGVKYRVRTHDGQMLGGPMYAWERGLGRRWVGALFAFFTLLVSFGLGNVLQGNAVAEVVGETYHVSVYVTAALLTLFVGIVILFGLNGITQVCSRLVPFMALFYIVGCIALLVINWHWLDDAVVLICRAAFTPQAMGGGFVGGFMIAAQHGVSRGLLSNESGLGSGPIIDASARTRNPVRQALVSSTAPFWDTVIICALTGIILVSSMLALGDSGSGDGGAKLLTQQAFAQIPLVGSHVLAVSLFVFAASTILSWTCYGEKMIRYIFRSSKRTQRFLIVGYRVLWVAFTFVGAVLPLELVWNVGTTVIALMAVPNLLSILLLQRVIVRDTRHYLWEGHLDEEMPEQPPLEDDIVKHRR
ncbi:MAG: sodium:alanine symporter family protein [Bacteroidaceae bacterium]|nr:sodium:alanine symporter family protein [Bacteroidaceae bacterium]